MTTIYLMRHGHAENPNQVFYGPEFGLSERGRRQAKALGQEMKEHGIRPAFTRCSPYPRAKETCRILSEILDGPVPRLDERLTEWQVGRWFGKPLKVFREATRYEETPPRMEDPRVEPLEDMARRIIEVIDEVKKEAAGSYALIVAHREPLVSAMLMLQGLNWDTIHDVDFPVATVWELTFDDLGKLTDAQKAFDHHSDT